MTKERNVLIEEGPRYNFIKFKDYGRWSGYDAARIYENNELIGAVLEPEDRYYGRGTDLWPQETEEQFRQDIIDEVKSWGHAGYGWEIIMDPVRDQQETLWAYGEEG